ncbi:general transcription factor 3C polypeptide 1-like [Lytechinus variegatus]|uniref:general transcription factor 3C polypeptide 1-like n=1 Tax=Lytechinus variegatus TaxID=7654 RepID=UPI001BB2B88A|nr:general transcription factor 3C polypeptide 1-like [Lytechinus variegatus]
MDNLEDAVLDEIALEGLNGVTLESLWDLLEQRLASFDFKCDDYMKNFIWEDLLCHHETISFYTVPEELLQLNENDVKERRPSRKKGQLKIQQTSGLIEDPVRKEMGYCPFYKERQDVTAEIRKDAKSGSLSLQQVTEKWGHCLMLVASQEARLHAILSPVSSVDLPLNTTYYCCLEIAGKNRYLGVSTQIISTKFDVTFSYVFHMFKNLVKLGVITKEVKGNIAYIYLIRFKRQPVKEVSLTSMILDYIKDQPNSMVPRYELVDFVLSYDYSYGQFKKVLKNLKSSKVVEAVSIPAKELPQYCPETVQSVKEFKLRMVQEEDNTNKERNPEDFQIVCVRLFKQGDITDDSIGNDGDDDADDDDDIFNRDIDLSKLPLDMELSDVQQVYYYTEKKQNESHGVSLNEVVHSLVMERTYVRIIMKLLTRDKLVKPLNFTTGKARVLRFFTQRGLDEATVPEEVLKLYQQQKTITLDEKQTPEKDDEVSQVPSLMDTGEPSDPIKSSPGDSNTAGKSKAVSRKPGTSFARTFENLERSRLVQDLVTTHHILEEHNLLKHVRAKEAESGLTAICCRKSLHRMILNMAEEGKVNYLTKEIKRKGKNGIRTEVIKIVSVASIKDGDPRVQDLLEKISPKQQFGTQPVKVPLMYRKLKSSGKPKIAMSDLLKSKMCHSLENRKNMERYGFCSKMERAEALHKYLWYLLYGTKKEGVSKLEPVERLSTKEKRALPEGCNDETEGQANIMLAERIRMTAAANDKSLVSNNEGKVEMVESPSSIECHLDTEDWRRYVTPGIQHIGWAKGWATMNDILCTLPLSIFVKVNSVTNEVPGLDEALKHPRIKHYPINIIHLQLFYGSDVNRVINNVHACLLNLSGMGLLYFDCHQRLQNRTRVNFYLCRTGSFLDTTSSATGSIQVEEKAYPKRSYNFTSMENVEQFWLDFKMNCFTTPLGAFKYEGPKEPAKDKKMLIMVAETIHQVPPEPVTIPGDGRGAAGLDTTFYAHRCSNWDRIKCHKPKKKTGKVLVKSEIKKEAEETVQDLASEGGGAKRKERGKVMKVLATEHKKATAGGKGQKRKRQKAKPTPDKPQVNNDVSVPEPADSGFSERALSDQRIAEKADERSKEQKKVASDSGPTDADLVAAETAGGSKVKKINQRSEEQKKVGSDPASTDADLVEGERDKNRIEKANKKSKGQKKTGPKRTPRSHLAHDLHIYDETDMQAKQTKILKRVKWSAREDNLLLLCGLALRFLKVKVTKCGPLKHYVHMSEVRNLLRENLEESCDKTSESCARRIRVLLKNDTNMSNFTVCLADIHADLEIMSKFMSGDKTFGNEAARRKEFRDLCMVLSKKFESQSKDTILAIPSTLEELYLNYDLINSNIPVAMTMKEIESMDVKSEEDITHHLLLTVVLISLLSHHFRQGEMKQIYYALKQYDTKQLQRALDTLKSHGFTGRNRGMQDVSSPQRALHAMPMSFQFTKTFFNLFKVPSIPEKILDETSMALDDIVAWKRDECSAPTLALDKMKGNRSSLLCIPALELAYDSVDIPKEIISLDLSASERAHLQKRHEEEMLLAIEEGDFEEEDDDSISGKSREGKRKASEISENVAPRKLRRHLVATAGRKKVAFVRTAHEEWSQKVADKQQTSEQGNKKVAMKSLIPRLLGDVKKEMNSVDASSVKPTMPSRAAVALDAASAARRSLALDHDYFMPKVAQTPETCQDEINPEDSSQETPREELPSDDSKQVDDTASVNSASTDGTPRATKSSSFFNWLTMRGFLTQDYTKKPQNIHEDIIVRRCSVFMTPTPSLISILDRFHVPSRQEHNDQDKVRSIKDTSHQRTGSSQPSISSSEENSMDIERTGDDGNQQTPIQSRNGTNGGDLVPREKSMSPSRHSESKARTSKSTTSQYVQTLGELIHQPCGPVVAFLGPHTSSDFKPSFRYTMNNPRRSLEDVCKGHEDHSHMLTIYQLVKAAGSLGLTYPRLLHAIHPNTHHARNRVFSCLRILLQEQLLLEVGTSVVRLVAQKNASKWLLKSVKIVPLPTTSTPPDNSGLASPAKKTKVPEESISQGGTMNGDNSVRDKQDVHCETHSSNQVPTDEILLAASINRRGEGEEFERDKEVSEENRLAETIAKDDDEALVSKGKKRKKGDKKEKIQAVEVKYEQVSILCHPWTNIDGSVSIKSLILFLSSVGLMIISKPGIKESDIFQHYQSCMSPVDCLHLFKILMNADIITRHSTYTSTKLNLFGAPLNTKPKVVIFYQPTVAALLNLTLLKNNLANSDKEES